MNLILILFLIFSNLAFGATIDEQITSLDTQAADLLNQRKALLASWAASDADVQLLNRLKAKTAQQRALADTANMFLAQKDALVKQKLQAQRAADIEQGKSVTPDTLKPVPVVIKDN